MKSTMLDLGPVNPGFKNAKLKDMQETLLPSAIENWTNLTGLQLREIIQMGEFFCKLHLLANFATEYDKVQKLF